MSIWNKGWVWVSPVGIVPQFFVISSALLTLDIINMTGLFAFIEAVSAVVVAVAACAALNQWKADKKYNEKRNISVALNRINLVVISFEPLIRAAEHILKNKDHRDDFMAGYSEGISRAERQVSQEILDLHAALVNTFTQNSARSRVDPDEMYQKIRNFLTLLRDCTIDEDKPSQQLTGITATQTDSLIKGSECGCLGRIANLKGKYEELKNLTKKSVEDSAYQI